MVLANNFDRRSVVVAGTHARAHIGFSLFILRICYTSASTKPPHTERGSVRGSCTAVGTRQTGHQFNHLHVADALLRVALLVLIATPHAESDLVAFATRYKEGSTKLQSTLPRSL